MKKKFITISVLLLLCTVAFAFAYRKTGASFILSLAITAGTFAYHFLMRLLVGAVFNAVMSNRANYTRPWYQCQTWEDRLYRKLDVKHWKGRLPTFDPDLFDFTKHSCEEIVQAMCQAELVHEANAVLSFLPLIASIWFGSLDVFFITSLLAALFDLLFVIMQRYNRPRVLRMIERTRPKASRAAFSRPHD